jgi:hypothetical protein
MLSILISLQMLNSKFVTGMGMRAFHNTALMCLNVRMQRKDDSEIQCGSCFYSVCELTTLFRFACFSMRKMLRLLILVSHHTKV